MDDSLARDGWKADIGMSAEVPLMSDDSKVECPNGISMKISMLSLGDWVIDATGQPTKILGIVTGLAEDVDVGQEWCTETYAWSVEDDCWRRSRRVGRGHSSANGRYLITESGTFIRLEKGQRVIQRDFTEIGYDRIHKTYPYVESRLR